MKCITVSLPDELVEKIKRAAGGNRQVSAYVAKALEDYQDRERLDDIVGDWQAETPVTDEVRQQAEAELDQAGLTFDTGALLAARRGGSVPRSPRTAARRQRGFPVRRLARRRGRWPPGWHSTATR